MVFQRLFQRTNAKHDRQARRRNKRRPMRLETLDKREVLAANIGQIAGIAFVDQSGDGLTGDDPRLSGVQVQLFNDVNTNGTFEGGTDTLAATVFTAPGTADEPGQYVFDDLSPGQYLVVQATSGTLTAPAPLAVTITADDADGATIVTIDDFTSGAQLVTATGGATEEGSAAAAAALGGARDVQVEHTNASGSISVQIDVGTELLSLQAGGGATGIGIVEYDGADGAFGLNIPPGFSPTSALAGGTAGDGIVATNTGLEVLARAENQDETLTVTVYSSATSASETTVTIPTSGALQSIFVDFSTFIQSAEAGVTSGADFDSIIGVRAQAESTLADNDIFFSVVESRGPDPVVTNLTNQQLVQLGGQVFIDNGPNPGEQNDGIRQGTEAGVEDVTVQLFQVAAPGDTVDPVNDVPIATVQSGPNGTYLFTGLVPGHYVTVIPISEFAPGQELFGHATSFGNDPTTDPDDNVDSDDDGNLVDGFGVVTGTITLESNSEPTDEVDDDDADGLNSNRNLTLDFGVIPIVDLAITKTLNAAASGDDEDDNAVFDIVVTNAGPLTATDVEVEDIIPAGLTFTGLANESTATATVAGTTVTVSLGDIVSGGSFSFQIVTSIDDNQTDDVTNTATVSTTDQVDTDPTNNTDDAVVDLRSTPLTIVKSDSVDPATAGGQFTYTIEVTNTSTTDTANGVEVRDSLPTGVTFVSGTVDGGSPNLVRQDPGSADPQDILATIGDLAPSQTVVVTILVDVATDAPATIDNTAVVSADPNTIPAANDNDDDEQTAINRTVDVQIDKTISTQNPIAGGNAFTYTIVVQNNGPSIAENVEVDDDLDDLLTYVANSFDDNGNTITFTQDGTDPTLLNFDIGDLTPGAANAVTFTFDVMLDSSATGLLDNVAVVSTTSADTDTTNNTDNVEVTVAKDVDLAITKAVNVNTAVPGVIDAVNPALVWTIEVTNNGVSDALGVTVVDDINDELNINGQITSVIVDAGAFTVTNPNNTPTVDFGTIPAGETRSFTISAEIPAGATGDIVNNAVVDSDDTTPVTSNDVTTTLTPQFDLIVDKTVTGTSNVGPGGQVTFDLVVSHDTAGTEVSPSAATGVAVTDLLPDGLTFVSATSGGSAVTTNNTVNADGTTTILFPDFDLATGATRTLTVVATADNDADGTLTNTASLATDPGETDTTNNDDDANVVVVPTTDVRVTKTVDLANQQVGGQVEYTVTVINDGPSTAAAVTAVDTLPAGLTFVSGTGPGGALTATGQTVTVNGGDLADDGSFQFTIIASIDAGATGTLQNSVSVSTTTNETDTNNNTAIASTTVDPMTSTINGNVYVDEDNDGVFDPDEAGIPGVTITLTGTDSLGNAINRTETTDANGFYEFTNLPQGTYEVAQTQPAGFRDGQDTVGTGATAVTNDDVFTQLGLAADTDAVDFNFGELAEALSKRRFLASS